MKLIFLHDNIETGEDKPSPLQEELWKISYIYMFILNIPCWTGRRR